MLEIFGEDDTPKHRMTVTPVPGHMIVFRGFDWHGVTPFAKGGWRYSLAMSLERASNTDTVRLYLLVLCGYCVDCFIGVFGYC